MFFLSNIGKTIKNSNDGITIQNIPVDKFAILLTSLVSIYNQIKARNETKGIDANMLANSVLCLEISEIRTIITDEVRTFIK